MTYWSDDRKLNDEQKQLDAEQARAKKRLDMRDDKNLMSVDEYTIKVYTHLLREAAGAMSSLIHLLEVSGASDDLVAELFPNAKKRNGQPMDANAKEIRRTINEARATLQRIREVLDQ